MNHSYITDVNIRLYLSLLNIVNIVLTIDFRKRCLFKFCPLIHTHTVHTLTESGIVTFF